MQFVRGETGLRIDIGELGTIQSVDSLRKKISKKAGVSETDLVLLRGNGSELASEDELSSLIAQQTKAMVYAYELSKKSTKDIEKQATSEESGTQGTKEDVTGAKVAQMYTTLYGGLVDACIDLEIMSSVMRDDFNRLLEFFSLYETIPTTLLNMISGSEAYIHNIVKDLQAFAAATAASPQSQASSSTESTSHTGSPIMTSKDKEDDIRTVTEKGLSPPPFLMRKPSDGGSSQDTQQKNATFSRFSRVKLSRQQIALARNFNLLTAPIGIGAQSAAPATEKPKAASWRTRGSVAGILSTRALVGCFKEAVNSTLQMLNKIKSGEQSISIVETQRIIFAIKKTTESLNEILSESDSYREKANSLVDYTKNMTDMQKTFVDGTEAPISITDLNDRMAEIIQNFKMRVSPKFDMLLCACFQSFEDVKRIQDQIIHAVENEIKHIIKLSSEIRQSPNPGLLSLQFLNDESNEPTEDVEVKITTKRSDLHALVIGISRYTSNVLSVPEYESDAIAFSESILKLGFSTSVLINSTLQSLEKNIDIFFQKVSQNQANIVVVYIAARIIEDDSGSFLLASDSIFKSTPETTRSGFPMAKIFTKLTSRGAKSRNIVLLESFQDWNNQDPNPSLTEPGVTPKRVHIYPTGMKPMNSQHMTGLFVLFSSPPSAFASHQLVDHPCFSQGNRSGDGKLVGKENVQIHLFTSFIIEELDEAVQSGEATIDLRTLLYNVRLNLHRSQSQDRKECLPIWMCDEVIPDILVDTTETVQSDTKL